MSDYDSVEWAVVGLVTTSVSVVGIIGNTLIIVFYKNTDTFTTLVRWLAVIDTVFVVGISFIHPVSVIELIHLVFISISFF